MSLKRGGVGNHETDSYSAFPLSREFYRATSKRPSANRATDQASQASNQIPRYKSIISNEINPPEVLSNRESITQNKLRRNKKQQTNRVRENKTLNLTGNVDLGSNVFKQNRTARRRNGTRRGTTTVTTPHPNSILEVFPPNHHRHNHYDSRQPKVYPTPYPTTSTTYRPETTTNRAYVTSSTTNAPEIPQNRTESSTQMSTKVLEKVIKLNATPGAITRVRHICSRNNGWRTSARSYRSCPTRRNSNT